MRSDTSMVAMLAMLASTGIAQHLGRRGDVLLSQVGN
jgi:hypothetical protein